MPGINFFDQDANFRLPFPKKHTAWIKNIIASEQKKLEELNYIFCSDNYLYQLNVEHLKHDTLTDIITFGYADDPKLIEGDIFISVERVRENALDLQEPFDRELKRVIAHGVLHLIGYNDKTESEARAMRNKENHYLSLFV